MSIGGGSGFGAALALSEPLDDGTRRLLVGEPGHPSSWARVHVYSVR